jgi:hypothetical protein
MRSIVIGVVLFALPACANEYHPDYHPESRYTYTQSISQPITVFNETNQQMPAFTTQAPPTNSSDPARIIVLETTHLTQPAQVVGVVDAHEPVGQHEAALWVLKTKAAKLGADAVVGVEFHHGPGEGEPTHLSGLAVRFMPAVNYPVEP